ncbi:hypothetical protein TSUD_61690 [Trifolium subterraneum]|uniref:Uncharacterized protein n=1 Tax=Trifolium subterraneum TaxID=3900 RepID=A0A2Z6N0E7_TRISU|nr:hypothetical protein TSUD_61690 [Trifolium subterraneum]
MDALHEVIQKIRESIRYIKSSQEVQGKFNEILQRAGINSQKALFLDNPIHWNLHISCLKLH